MGDDLLLLGNLEMFNGSRICVRYSSFIEFQVLKSYPPVHFKEQFSKIIIIDSVVSIGVLLLDLRVINSTSSWLISVRLRPLYIFINI